MMRNDSVSEASSLRLVVGLRGFRACEEFGLCWAFRLSTGQCLCIFSWTETTCIVLGHWVFWQRSILAWGWWLSTNPQNRIMEWDYISLLQFYSPIPPYLLLEMAPKGQSFNKWQLLTTRYRIWSRRAFHSTLMDWRSMAFQFAYITGLIWLF